MSNHANHEQNEEQGMYSKNTPHGTSRRPAPGTTPNPCRSARNYRKTLQELHDVKEPYGLIFLCLPTLPAIAEEHGVKMADDVVEVVCNRLKRCVRNSDDAMQINEFEYLVVIRGAYDMGLYQNLHDRIQSIVEADIALDDTHLSVQVEFGYARFPEDGQSVDEVVDAARAAMGRASRSRKRRSRRQIEIDATEAAIAAMEDDRPHVDTLTGLPDANYFRIKASEALELDGAKAQDMVMVFCDVEKFKEYNLKYGYSSGNDLLKFVADTLEDSFPGDLIARLNSDRFGILTTSENVVEKIQQVHDLVWGFRLNSSIELKAGICEVKGNVTAIQAQDYARLACDSIKGRYDRIWRSYDDKLASEVARRQHIIDNLDTAISSGWIEVYYQPIIRTLTGCVCGMEALVRWNDPEFGMLPPSEFIDVLEDAHLIYKLDVHITKRVVEDGMRIMKSGRAIVPTSINLSRLDYQLCDIFGIVEDVVTKAGYPRNKLHIEFTESAFTRDSDFFLGVVNRFREAGYEVWMDDFGSGYSSLNLLKDYSFDVLKIDMEFLRGLENNPKTHSIIASVVDMGKKLGIQTLAEGVETEEHFRFLKTIGCEKAQGYLFCKPSPLSYLLEQVAAGTLVVEPDELTSYYDDIGRVNILSPSPFDFDASDSMSFTSELPIAMVEYADGSLKALLSSASFDEALQESEIASVVDSEIAFDTKGERILGEFLKLEQKAYVSKSDEYIDFYDFKDFYTLRMLFVSEHDNRRTYLVSFSKHDMTKGNQEAYQPKTDKLVYLPEAQITPWQQSDEIDLAHTAIVVIDVLGGTEGITPGLEEMAANSVALVKAARAKGMPIIFNSDNHIRGLDKELELWGDHGVRGEQNGEPLVEFEVADTDFFIPKRRYNGFFETDLELTLRELGISTLIAVGADTNICVLQTLAGAYFYGYKTIVPSDATATFLIGTQESGLEYLQRCYDTRITTTASLLDRINEMEPLERA